MFGLVQQHLWQPLPLPCKRRSFSSLQPALWRLLQQHIRQLRQWTWTWTLLGLKVQNQACHMPCHTLTWVLRSCQMRGGCQPRRLNPGCLHTSPALGPVFCTEHCLVLLQGSSLKPPVKKRWSTSSTTYKLPLTRLVRLNRHSVS